MLPKVQPKRLRRQVFHQLRRIREISAPNQGAGIRARLPTRLQADHVARHAAVAGFGGGLKRRLPPVVALHPIPHAQAPARRQRTAAREEVVALHSFAHRRPTEDVHVHAFGHRYLHQNFRGVLETVLPVRCGQRVQTRRRNRFVGGWPRAFPLLVARVDGDVARRVHQHAISGGGNVERHRRVRIARVHFGIGIHAQQLLQAALHQGLKLQP